MICMHLIVFFIGNLGTRDRVEVSFPNYKGLCDYINDEGWKKITLYQIVCPEIS